MKLSEFGKRLDQQRKNQQNEQGLGETIGRHRRASEIFSQPQEFHGIDLGEYTGYTGDNINIMRDNIDELRAQNQSGWEQAYNSISQAALGMTVGGSLEGFGYLMEVPRNVAAVFTDTEQNWEGNFLSNLGKGIREGIEDARPIHMTEQAQSGELSRFGDSSWWWGNAPSIASTLSLMIPTMAVTRGVGAAAKGMRRARQSARPTGKVQPERLTQSQKLQIETIGSSFTQRHMYSTMESYDEFEQSYKEAIQDGYSHDEAIQSASEAAANNYKLGYMNIWKDVIQWGTVLRGMKHANLKRGQTLAQRTRAQPDNSLLKRMSQVGGKPGKGSRFSLTGRDSASGITPFGYASMAIGEGFEEFNIQWQKAYSRVLSKYNNDMLEEMPSFSEFMGEQVKDAHAWDAAIWGTFGGGLFGAIGPALARTGRKQQLEQEKQKLNKLIQTANVTRDNIKEYTDQLAKGDSESANFARENIIMKMGIEGAAEGDIGVRREMFENISQMSDEQLAEIEMQPEARDYANQAIEQLDRIEQKYNQYANYDYGYGEVNNALAQIYTELDFIKENQQKQYNHYSNKINEARNQKSFRQNEMNSAARTHADNLKRKQVLEGLKTSMEQNSWRTNKEKNDFIELANKRLRQVNEDITESEQALSETTQRGKVQQQKKFAEMDANMHNDEIDALSVREQSDIMIEYVDNERNRMSDKEYVQKLVDNRKKTMEGRSERINEQEDQEHAEQQDERQEDNISDEVSRQEQTEGEVKQSSSVSTSQKDNLNQDRSDPLTREERENLKNYEKALDALLEDSQPSSKQIEGVLGSEGAADYLGLKSKEKRALKDEDQSGEQKEGESLNQSEKAALNSLENKEQVTGLDETEQDARDRLGKKKTDTEPSVSDHSVGQSQLKSNRQNEDSENRQQSINVSEPPIARSEEAGSFNVDNPPKKGSVITAAYKDPLYYPNEDVNQWSQDFSNWVNDPNTNVVGEQVSLEIDFDYLQSRFPKMYEKIQKGESLTNSELGSLPVMARVDNANVYTYLHTDKFGEGPNGIHARQHDIVIARDNQDYQRYLTKTLEDQRSALRDVKGEVLQAYQNNETVTTTISGQSKGLPKFIEGHQPLEINNLKLGMYHKQDIIDQNNKPLPIKTHAKVEGAIHALVPASDGTMTTSSLQRSRINEQEASLVADALISIIKNEGTDAIQTQTMIGDQGGLTNQEIIDLFKYDNPRNRNVATIKNKTELKVGKNTYNPSNVDNARNEIIEQLQQEFVNVKREKLNENLFKGLKNDQFQLFGNEFKKSDNYNYNDFVISNQAWRQEPLLQTNFDSYQYTHNNEPKVRYTGQSSVYFSKFSVPAYEVETTNKPLKSSEGKKSEQSSVATVNVDQYNISIHEDGRMYFQNGNEVVDQRIRNKALVEHERPQYPDRETTFDNSSYFVLQDDRIISLTKTNYGKEVFSKKSNDSSTVKKRNRILNQVEHEQSEPKQVQKPEKKQRRNFSPKNPGFRTQNSESQSYEHIDQARAKNWLQSVLPNTPVHVVDKLIDLSNDGTKAYGAFVMGADAVANIGYDQGIMISNLQPSDRSQRGTEFHEAFHAVFRTYLSEREINDILSEARQEYGDQANEVLEERLAEDFRRYMLDTEYADTFTGKIKQFFQDLLQFVQDLFRGQRVKDRIFEQISTGRFADVQPLDSRSERFVSDKVLRRVEIPGLSHTQVDSFVRMFTFGLFNEHKFQDLSDMQNIVVDENSIGGFAQFAQDQAREIGDNYLVERYEKVKDNIEYFVDAVKDHLQRKYSMHEVEGDIQEHTLEHSDINRKDRATPNAKLLVATLPKLRHESDLTQFEMDNMLGKKYEYNPDTGMPELVDFDATWNLISKMVSDIPNTFTENVNFSYERDVKASKIIDKLEKAGKYIPELNELADRLKDTGENALPEYKKQQFFSAISKARVNFTTTTIDRHGSENTIQSFDSATNSIENKLIRKWNQDLLFNSQIIRNGNRFNVNNAEQLIDRFNSLRSRIKDEEIRSYNSVTTQNMEVDISKSLLLDLSSILSELGINLNQNALDYHLDRMQIRNPDQTRGQLLNMLYRDLSVLFDPTKRASSERSLRTLIEEAKDSKKPIQADERGNIETFIHDESIIRDLAESESIFHEHIGENMSFGPEGNKQYNYSLNSFLTETKNQIKESPEYLMQVQESIYGGNSKYAEYLLDEGRFQNFDIRQKQTFRELNAGDQGTKYAKLNSPDKFVDRVTNTINGNIQTIVPADKSRLFEMTGVPVVNAFNGVDANGNIEFTSEVYETMIGYLIDELTRMKTVQTMIDNNRSHHLDENIYKNYQSMFTMPSLSPDQISVSDNREMGLYHEGTKKPKVVHEVNLKSNRALRQHIKDILNERVQENINDAQNFRIIDENFKNFGFDTNMFKSYRQKTASIKQAVQAMMTDYTANGIIGNIETTKLFTGDPAFYKDIPDLMKRVPEIIAPRQELMIDEYIGKTFTVATVRDDVSPSQIFDPESEFFAENLEKFKQSLPRLVKKRDADGNPVELANDVEHDNRARDLLSAYSNIEKTDAQAYISPHRWRKLMHGLGMWKKEYDASFNRLMRGEQTAEDTALIMQPIKGVYYSMEMDGQTGMMTPRYFKYSQAPLFPSLVENTTGLKQLYNKMIDQGIDEIMFETANKVGKTNINDLNADVFETVTLSNEGWGLQQENPSKYHKEGQTNDGTQRRHNIYANVSYENNYTVESHPDKTLDGRTLYEHLQQADIQVTEREMNQLLEDLDAVDEAGNPTQIKNIEYLYDAIIDQMKQQNVADNVIEQFQRDSEGGVNPFDSIIADKEKIQNITSSIITSRTVDQKHQGGAFIQKSVWGMEQKPTDYNALTQDQQNRIIWLTDDQLKPPRYENGEFKFGDIMIPHDALDQIEGIENMSHSQIIEYLNNDTSALEGVAYRIPNQGKASIDAVRIAGILPKEMRDTVVMYPDITTKTGSDFDIDKMYVALPHYRATKQGIQRVQFHHVNEQEGATNEDLARIYKDRYEPIKSLAKKLENRKNEIEQQAVEEGYSITEDIGGDFTTEMYEFFGKKNFDYKEYERVKNKATEVPTLNEFIDNNVGKSSFEVNSKSAIQNYKMELEQSILASEHHFAEMMTPIDAAWLKNDIQSIYKDQVFDDLKMFNPKFQLDYHQNQQQAGQTIGIIANHLRDHAIAQMAGNTLSTDLRLFKREENTRLDGITDEHGYLISDNINADINSVLDVAKDDFIVRANVNPFTSNTYQLLRRSGVDREWTNRFIGQPIIRRLKELNDINESTVGESLKINGKRVSPEQYVRHEFGNHEYIPVDPREIPKDKMENAIQKWLDGEVDQMSGSEQSFQLQILDNFINIDKYAGKLNDAILATKADVTTPKNIQDAIISEHRLARLHSDKYGIVGFENRFNGTAVGKKYEASVQLLQEATDGLFLENTPGYRSAMNNIFQNLKDQYPIRNIRMADHVKHEVFGYIASGSPITNLKQSEVHDLFFGENSVAKRIFEVQKDENHSFHNTYLFRDFFEVSTSEQGPDLIRTNNTEIRNKDILASEFYNLWSDENTRQLAEDIATISYYHSGFRQGMHSFHDIIDNRYIHHRDVDFGGYIRAMMDHMETNNLEGFETQFYKHNADNRTYVPRLPQVEPKRLYDNVRVGDKSLGDRQAFILNDEGIKQYAVAEGREERLVFPKFISRKEGQDIQLYEHIGDRYIADGMNYYPIYRRTNKLGYNHRGVKIYEYNMQEDNPHAMQSIISENNVEHAISDKMLESAINNGDIVERTSFERPLTSTPVPQTDDSGSTNIPDSKVEERRTICKGR